MGASGSTSGPAVVEFLTLIDGFMQAHERWDDARLQIDPLSAFFPLFETLAWTYAIDGYLKERDGHSPSQPEFRALRFARHRVHHNWADALWLDERGAQFPIQFPATFFEWRWRNVEDLPTGYPTREEARYRQANIRRSHSARPRRR
jgi:hypothetical protein